MASTKTPTMTFCIDPAVTEALCAAAARNHRSVDNMVQAVIRDYCYRYDSFIEEGDIVIGALPSCGRKDK